MLLLRRVCSTTSLRLIGPWRPIASSTAKARDTAGARSTFAVLVLERLSTVLRLRHGRPILARMPVPGRAGHDRCPAPQAAPPHPYTQARAGRRRRPSGTCQKGNPSGSADRLRGTSGSRGLPRSRLMLALAGRGAGWRDHRVPGSGFCPSSTAWALPGPAIAPMGNEITHLPGVLRI